jgi:cation diffusion facilitator CzcD-associated flavoprotein CzcO
MFILADCAGRPTPGNGYLEALTQDNVTVSWGAPQQLTEKSIILHDGVELEPDVIVCATGFDLSYKPRFPLVGRNGVDLGEYWTPDARAYMSLTVPNFPNYFRRFLHLQQFNTLDIDWR